MINININNKMKKQYNNQMILAPSSYNKMKKRKKIKKK